MAKNIPSQQGTLEREPATEEWNSIVPYVAGTASPRRSQQSPLQLEALANFDGRFNPEIWKRLVAAFDRSSDLAREFATARVKVPQPAAVRDPFVSALRRMRWPSDRLPIRHFRALDGVGRHPLGLVSLALEEARTSAWRSFDRAQLIDLAPWLARLPFKKIDRTASIALLAAVRTYNALFAVCFEHREDYLPVIRQMRELFEEHPPKGPNLVESFFVRALLAARMNEAARAHELFLEAEAEIGRCDKAERPELVLWLGIFRSMAVDFLAGDPVRADELRIQTIKASDDRSDPWLPLLLHHEAARAALLDVGQLWLESGRRRSVPFQTRFFRQAASRPDRMGQALAHLETAEKLFQELAAGLFAIHHLSLHGHALALENPVKGLDLLVDALERAVNGWDQEETTRVAATIASFVQNLAASGSSPIQIEEHAKKARKVLAAARAIHGRY